MLTGREGVLFSSAINISCKVTICCLLSILWSQSPGQGGSLCKLFLYKAVKQKCSLLDLFFISLNCELSVGRSQSFPISFHSTRDWSAVGMPKDGPSSLEFRFLRNVTEEQFSQHLSVKHLLCSLGEQRNRKRHRLPRQQGHFIFTSFFPSPASMIE